MGSPLALKYLRPDWVAPLGSSSLIFNFLFARWLVGTRKSSASSELTPAVTANDIKGTAVIVLGVILILVFSSINHGLSQHISISDLNGFWTRASWIAFFVLLILFTTITYTISSLLKKLLASRASYSPISSPTQQKTLRFARWRMLVNRYQKAALVRMERLFGRTGDARLLWLQGVGWAVAGGCLAGGCLVFTKALVKIFWLPGHPVGVAPRGHR